MKAVVPISACMKNLEALSKSAHADLEQELYFTCNIAKMLRFRKYFGGVIFQGRFKD